MRLILLSLCSIVNALNPSEIDQMFLDYIQSTEYREAIMPDLMSQECFELLISFVESPDTDQTRDQFCEESFLPKLNGTYRIEISSDDYLASNDFFEKLQKYMETESESDQGSAAAILQMYFLNNDLHWLSVADSYRSLLVGQLVSQVHIRSIIGQQNNTAALGALQNVAAELRQYALDAATISTNNRSTCCWWFRGRNNRIIRSFLAQREEEILKKSESNFHVHAHIELERLWQTVDQILFSTWPIIINVVRTEIVPSLLSMSHVFAPQSTNLGLLFEIVSLTQGNSSPSYWPIILRSILVAITHLKSAIPTT
jgi:hypothetical protein